MVKLGHARISEKGTIEGVAGDQTGHEVEVSSWYNGGWLCVYRPNSEIDADLIAGCCESVCRNDHVGYSQDDRQSLTDAAITVNYEIEKISRDVNTDCSALVAMCCNAAGMAVSRYMTTRNEDLVLMGTGKFTRLQSSKYTAEPTYLKRGDILRKSGHTAIVVQGADGAANDMAFYHTPVYADYFDKTLAGEYKATDDVYMREGGAQTYKVMCTVFIGNSVRNYGYYSIDSRGVKWLYVEYIHNNILYTGFVSSRILNRG